MSDVAAEPNPYEAPRASADGDALASEFTRDELTAFAGHAGPHYWHRWSRRGARTPLLLGWHWPAAIFGVFWFAYRKLWREGLVLLGAETAWNTLEPIVARQLGRETLIGYWMMLVEAVILGLLGTGLYVRRARLEIARAHRTFPEQPVQRSAQLREVGGTNGWWLLVAIGVSVALGFLQGRLMGGVLSLLA